MKIQDIYDKDISRRINPAVVVSEMEDYFVKQEIDEYVFTPGITKNMFKFLDAVVNKKEGKSGIWISGYYGSGKSHFIKYLFYCLNEKYREKALENFKISVDNLDPLEEPTTSIVSSLHKKLNDLEIEEIIFNIDAVAEDDGEKDKITRVLLKKLNAFRGYNNSNIALAIYLEKILDKNGDFDAFKNKIKEKFQEDWDGNQIRFTRMYLDKVIEIATEFDSNLDKESLKSTILNKKQDYSIEFLIDELKDFLSTKPESYRLLFLMDEISQYIGSSSSLLLNLQTIVEEISSKIGTKVWIVCTAQQDLSSLISNRDRKTEDFGKILGRFETMISLESQDAAFITKKRVLEKNSNGIGFLSEHYQENKGAIENQFVFDHDLYPNYQNREDFLECYPFIPYQFRLISDVIMSLSNVGYVSDKIKNTERAILGIVKDTAETNKEKEVGEYIPFDSFFSYLMQYLEHNAREILDKAYNIDQVKKDVFAQRVVNALFMISNLGESQSVNFPATMENLALLLMESTDTPKLEMQKEVKTILEVLVSKNIIQISEGKYRFLKEDEIEVANLIKNTTVLEIDRLDYIYDDIIKRILKPNPVVQFGNKNFRIAFKIDDKDIGGKGDFNLKFSIYDASDIENLAHSTPTNDMLVGISEWLRNDTQLRTQILDYVRTQKFISKNTSSATGTRMKTLNNFRDTNKILLSEIKMRFEDKFIQTAIVSCNQVIPSNDLKGATASARFDDMIKRHMEEVYKKHELSTGYASSNAELLSNAKSTQKQTNTKLTPTEEELNTKLSFMGEAAVVGDIVKNFEKPPYGWKDISTLDVLLKISKKGIRRFEWRNEEIDSLTFVEKATNSRERDAITVHKEKVHSQDEINKFIQVINHDVFNENLIPSDTKDFKEAVESFKLSLSPKLSRINDLKDEYEAYPFSSHLKSFHKSLAEIYNTNNAEQVVDKVLAQKNDLKEARDTFMHVEEFIQHNFKAYEKIMGFVDDNKNNFSSLEETLKISSEKLTKYLKTEHEPWEKFPEMKKIYKELNTAVNERLSNLKTEVLSLYETIFEEIEARKQGLEIDASHITATPEYYLKRIEKEEQITQLEIYQLKAKDFKTENLKKLEDFKAQEEAKKTGEEVVTSLDVSIAAEMAPTTIENEEQLNKYLKTLKAKLMVKLSKNQKIWLS